MLSTQFKENDVVGLQTPGTGKVHGRVSATAPGPTKSALKQVGGATGRRILGDITNQRTGTVVAPSGSKAVGAGVAAGSLKSAPLHYLGDDQDDDDIETLPAFCAPSVEPEVDLRLDAFVAMVQSVRTAVEPPAGQGDGDLLPDLNF